MAPELRDEELDADGAAVIVTIAPGEAMLVAGVELVDEEDVLVELGVELAEEDPPGSPLAVRLTYAAQSGLGSARVQVLAWHRESSSGP